MPRNKRNKKRSHELTQPEEGKTAAASRALPPSKRAIPGAGSQAPRPKQHEFGAHPHEHMDFEDEYGDEIVQEQIVGHEDGAPMAVGKDMAPEEEQQEEYLDDDSDEMKAAGAQARVFRPGVDMLDANEQMDYDSSTYLMYHKLRVEWPCLSFDIVSDLRGAFRKKFPHTLYLAVGTQADRAENNKLSLLKCSELHKTQHDDADPDDVSDSDPDDLDDDPIIEEKFARHPGGVNRVRCMPQQSNIVATWSDTGQVLMWDVGTLLASLDEPPPAALPPVVPVQGFRGHQSEGFALAWSNTIPGRMISGDCARQIYLWNPVNRNWTVDQAPFVGHTESVEDLQWSPVEPNVFASCSVDRTVRIWDTRTRRNSMLSVNAHDVDVNVIAWNPRAAHLLVSGSDDGSFKIWDLRTFRSNSPAGHFKWHSAPITSVEWHPFEDSVLSVSSSDNSLTVWDLALEHDPDAHAQGAELGNIDVPPQLLFVHSGQQDIKELHFHRQIPDCIVSTAADGINIFQPANMNTVDPRAQGARTPAAKPM